MKSVILCSLGCTSQFFLSDEGGDVEMPLRINDGRASLKQKVDFNYEYNCPQKIEPGRLKTVGMATGHYMLVLQVAEHTEVGPQKWPTVQITLSS